MASDDNGSKAMMLAACNCGSRLCLQLSPDPSVACRSASEAVMSGITSKIRQCADGALNRKQPCVDETNAPSRVAAMRTSAPKRRDLALGGRSTMHAARTGCDAPRFAQNRERFHEDWP